MKIFKPNRKFKREYNRLFRMDPSAANLFLLMCELADETGQVEIDDEELALLFSVRFDDLEAYQL